MPQKTLLFLIVLVYWSCDNSSNKLKQYSTSKVSKTIRTSKIHDSDKLLETTFNSEQIIIKEDTLIFYLKTDSSEINPFPRRNRGPLSYLSVFDTYEFLKEDNNYKWLKTPLKEMATLGVQISDSTTIDTLIIKEQIIELIKLTVKRTFSQRGSFGRGFSPYSIHEEMYFHPTYGILVNLKEKQSYEKTIIQTFAIINELKDFNQHEQDNEIIQKINNALIHNFITTKQKEFENQSSKKSRDRFKLK